MIGVSLFRRPERPISRRRKWLAGALILVCSIGLYLLSATTIVLNGTTSLPHTAYFMVSKPRPMIRGAYVAFDPTPEVASAFQNLAFIKRIVGLEGDVVTHRDGAVCVRDECRTLEPRMIAAGYKPAPEGPVPEGKIMVFADAPNSIDSGYAVIGAVRHESVRAVGIPLALPHWKEMAPWLASR